jgi:hypothetical protein
MKTEFLPFAAINPIWRKGTVTETVTNHHPSQIRAEAEKPKIVPATHSIGLNWMF